MGKAYIGTSGWNYKHWSQGVFYPKDLKPSEWLKYFVGYFDTVEINNSFYRLPSEAVFQSWRTQVPHHFVFAVKASRFITHIKRLKDPEEPLALFFSRVKYLNEWLGRGLDVYVYFNNDMGGHAIGNAKYVQALLDQRRQR